MRLSTRGNTVYAYLLNKPELHFCARERGYRFSEPIIKRTVVTSALYEDPVRYSTHLHANSEDPGVLLLLAQSSKTFFSSTSTCTSGECVARSN